MENEDLVYLIGIIVIVCIALSIEKKKKINWSRAEKNNKDLLA